MAAAPDIPARAGALDVVELRHLDGGALDAVLEEETQVWKQGLRWDFRSSANLVGRYLDLQALHGFALRRYGASIGYSYYVCEERKGLIGDLYIQRDFSTAEAEVLLLRAVLDALARTPVRRVESQLMMLRHAKPSALPRNEHLRVFERQFLEISRDETGGLKARVDDGEILFDSWTERRQDEAATMISSSYRRHIDSEINDQYRSPAGARKFLLNIIQYPGCGSFFQPASFIAVDRSTGQLRGMCLSSLVAPDAGHITQVCVAPTARGRGIGYELIRRSLEALFQAGCGTASLTVTSANTEAIELYFRMGFSSTKTFAAHVWDGL